MEKIYYIVINGSQEGPFSKEELRIKNLAPNTLIWRAGMPQWVKIVDFAEVADILPIDITEQTTEYTERVSHAESEDNGWFAMLGDRRLGPGTVTELIASGVTRDTPVWHPGMADWANASTQREFNERFNATTPPNQGQNFHFEQQPNFGQNPQYGQQQPNFGQNPQYGQQQPNYGQQNFGQTQNSFNRFGNQNPYGNQRPFGNQNSCGNQNPYGSQNQFGNQPIRTNWLPWAIVATVVSFISSCVGSIFGIIAIIQASKANGLYAAGFDSEGDQANNTAKTMTIIAGVLAVVGLVSMGLMFKNFSLYNIF